MKSDTRLRKPNATHKALPKIRILNNTANLLKTGGGTQFPIDVMQPISQTAEFSSVKTQL